MKGIVTTVTKVREEKTYRIINRSQTDRTVMIELPNRTNQQFKVVDAEKPVEGVEGVAVHLCRRNWGRRGWGAAGGYETILPHMKRLKVSQLMLEITVDGGDWL